MSFHAKYRGACDACDDPIHIGQEVEFTYDNHLVHVICPESLGPGGKPRPVCPRCFMELPTTGECGTCDPE